MVVVDKQHEDQHVQKLVEVVVRSPFITEEKECTTSAQIILTNKHLGNQQHVSLNEQNDAVETV